MKLIYIAAPFTHKDHAVRQRRRAHTVSVECALLESGYAVINPLRMSQDVNAGLTEAQWRRVGLAMLRRCDAMIVIALPGWSESVGLQGEIAAAEAAGISIHWIPDTYHAHKAIQLLEGESDEC